MVGFWNAMPAMLTGPVTSAPSTVTRPLVGRMRPVVSFISEDLPQPDGPTTAAKPPFSTLMEADDSALRSASPRP